MIESIEKLESRIDALESQSAGNVAEEIDGLKTRIENIEDNVGDFFQGLRSSLEGDIKELGKQITMQGKRVGDLEKKFSDFMDAVKTKKGGKKASKK